VRDVVRSLVDLVLPVGCGGCGVAGEPWCPRCAASLGQPVRVRPPCAACGAAVYALGSYRGALRTALLAYKERGRRDLAVPLGRALAAALPRLDQPCGAGPGGWTLVPAPSRWSAVTRRGGAHVALLAECAAAALAGAGARAAVAPALRMGRGVADSVGLDRAAREANLAGRVLVRTAGLPAPGTPVVLVDDVVTTGATAAACVAALRQAGVVVPSIVAVASAHSDHRSSFSARPYDRER
jgi:predicted amidophosphoribosyltransferase